MINRDPRCDREDCTAKGSEDAPGRQINAADEQSTDGNREHEEPALQVCEEEPEDRLKKQQKKERSRFGLAPCENGRSNSDSDDAIRISTVGGDLIPAFGHFS